MVLPLLALLAAPAGAWSPAADLKLLRKAAAEDGALLDAGPIAPPQDAVSLLAYLLADPAVSYDDKAAALMALSSEEFRRLGDGTRVFLDYAQEPVLVSSLRWLSDSADPAVRPRAIRALGAFAPSLRTDLPRAEAVEALASVAGRHDGLRRAALYALSMAAGGVPSRDARSLEAGLGACYDVLWSSRDEVERGLAMLGVYRNVRRNGSVPYDQSPALMRRLRQELIDPLRGGPDPIYDAHNGTTYREALYGTLHVLARGHSHDPALRWDAGRILQAAAQSRRETDARLRQLLALYTTGRLPGLR